MDLVPVSEKSSIIIGSDLLSPDNVIVTLLGKIWFSLPAVIEPPLIQIFVAVIYVWSIELSNYRFPSTYRVPKVNSSISNTIVQAQGIKTSSPS